jgi:regulatory protein
MHAVAVITQITMQKRAPNRRNIHLDGAFAFGCNLNVVAQFRLREGMTLTAEQVRQIQQGEVRQECFDHALRLLRSRLHSRAELARKLARKEYGQAVVDGVLDDLQRLGYLDDARFAQTRAAAAAEHKHHGRRRALLELRRSGVPDEIAEKALDDVYGRHDTAETARLLAQKQAPRLRKLDPAVARRRLVCMIQRRGYEYDQIKPIVDEALGGD